MHMTNAIIWLRVSDSTQDETNQLPDLERWCAEHSYHVTRTVFVHGKSAWKKGKLDKDKTAVLDALKSGAASVVVVWSVDRWSRTGIADTVDGLKLVREAGGRVEFVKDQILNAEGEVAELLLAILAWVARWESEHRSDRTRNGMDRERANGKIMGGSVALGYKLVNGVKVRDEKALDVVAEVHERSVRGESTATIGDFIRRSGYKRADNTVADILRNPEYVTDGVVSPHQQKKALEALEKRRTGQVRRTSEQDYSGMLHCRCGSVMHRKLAGAMPAKGVEATRYYRCSDHESRPVPMVRADDADALVDHVMGGDHLPWLIPVRTGGDTRDAEVGVLRKELEAAVREGASRAVVNELYDKIDAVMARQPEPERVAWVASGKTRGEHWQELTAAERRAWLDNEETTVTAWNVKEPAAGWVTAEGTWAKGKVRLSVTANDQD